MRSPEQLELEFSAAITSLGSSNGHDAELETRARKLLRSLGVPELASVVRVEWSGRLRSAAGRADSHRNLILLNPRLLQFGDAEVDRTLRHELAHLLAHARKTLRIAPHGREWRDACAELGIPDETRCHTLPFPVIRRRARYLYRCQRCRRDFPRVRRIRRISACLACCREINRGRFDRRAQLRLVAER